MEHQLLLRIGLDEGGVDRLGKRRLRVVPGHVGDAVLRESAERAVELRLVHPGIAGSDDPHRVPTLLDHLPTHEDGVVQAADKQQKIRVGCLRLGDLDRQVPGRGVIGDGVDYFEREEVQPWQDGPYTLGHSLPKGVVDVHEYGCPRHGVRGAEDVAYQGKSVAHQIDCGGKVAKSELVTLLGKLWCRGDVDDERHTLLLTHLGNGGGCARIESPDQHLGAIVDQLLGTRAGHVNVGLRIHVHEPDGRFVAQ